jgi:hypothetical protein
MNINDEIWLDGVIVIFNGFPPNVIMRLSDNYIIGIKDEDIPEIIDENLFKNRIKGTFKLKLTNLVSLPYYENKLMVFKIIDYKNIELIEN